MRVNLVLLLGFVAVIWVVEFVNLFTGHALDQYGTFPRTVQGLRGIALGPFIHGSMGHVLANTPPLLILGGLSAVRGREAFPWVSLFIIVAGGAGVWAVGRSALHIGASGLVFGYFGYLVGRGWYDKSILSILVAVAVIVVFSWGMLMGILPTGGIVSWEGHLCGLLAGVLVASMTRRGRDRTA